MHKVNIHPSVLNAQKTRDKYAKLNILYDKHDEKRNNIFKYYYFQIIIMLLNLSAFALAGLWLNNLAHH